MPITLVGMVKRGNMIDLKYAEAADDPQPFILTITPQYVAQQTAKPIIDADLPALVRSARAWCAPGAASSARMRGRTGRNSRHAKP